MSNQKYSTFSFGQRNLLAENHWQTKPITDFKITKPTIICLGGNGTIETRKANNVCKLVESLMGIKIESTNDITSSYKDVEIVGLSYGKEKETDTIGTINKEECEEIVNALFVPLCTDKSGNPLSVHDSCKNFSNLTFFTHCYGADVLNMLMTNLNQKLQNLGYSNEDIHNIYGQAFQVSYAPYHNDSWLPNVRVDSMTDSHHRDLYQTYPSIYGHKLDGIESYIDKAFTFRGKPYPYTRQDTISIYTSRLINITDNTDLSRLIDEHNVNYLQRDANWRSDGCTVWENAGNERWQNTPINLDIVSQAMGYVLSRSVANSINNASTDELIEKPAMEDLKVEVDSILESVPKNDLKMPTHPEQ